METTPVRHLTLHLPLGLLALAVAALLASQIGASHQSAILMNWQIETTQKNLEEMQALEKQYAEAITNRETTVAQSNELQGKLQTLLTDLMELAKEDPQAEQIIKKWNVQQTAKAGSTETSAPSEAAAAATP